ncbi:MAG: outer membrane protein transport protein, partial [Betaproteobacteria bacterium]|nr:outer membrane protein transport protein [Betaproteobacteria bacterium]
APNGPGFGWENINVWKLGAEYKYNDNWTLRAGWNHCDNPVQPANAMVDLLVPGVITDHLTLGGTYTTASGNQWTFAYVHAFGNSVTGPALAPNGQPIPGDMITTRMDQDTVGIAYAWKL